MLVSVVLLVCPGMSEALEFQCPARVNMQPAIVTDAPDDWHASQRLTQLSIEGVSMSFGPREARGDLKPDIRITKRSKTFSWDFLPADHVKGIWLSCGYGNSIALSQRLPEGITRCSAVEASSQDGHSSWVTSCR
jgi:hypothetical protein